MPELLKLWTSNASHLSSFIFIVEIWSYDAVWLLTPYLIRFDRSIAIEWPWHRCHSKVLDFRFRWMTVKLLRGLIWRRQVDWFVVKAAYCWFHNGICHDLDFRKSMVLTIAMIIEVNDDLLLIIFNFTFDWKFAFLRLLSESQSLNTRGYCCRAWTEVLRSSQPVKAIVDVTINLPESRPLWAELAFLKVLTSLLFTLLVLVHFSVLLFKFCCLKL